jgi:SMC interacting uncharacterized protein involved in chromosome segregation
MVTDTDVQDIKDNVDRLAEKHTDIADEIKDGIDRLKAEYEDRIDSLEDDNATLASRVEDLEEELEEKEQELANSNLEDFASSILRTFTGHDPNMGEVLSLKDDLEKLLTTKYNISLGNL